MKKSYFAIIPANVRYDKSLKANAKLLYGEITALCNEKGYCWANNKYFADLYEVSTRTITNWIGQLASKGYIKSELIYEKGSKEVKQRRIYLAIGIEENFHTPIEENFHTPIEENFQDNNTSFNNKEYSASKNAQPKLDSKKIENYFEEVWKLYPSKKGKGQVSNSKKKEIYKLGDEFIRCINRYKEDTKHRRESFPELKYQNGSTFFNSGYVDYLDRNYVETKKEEKEIVDPYAGWDEY